MLGYTSKTPYPGSGKSGLNLTAPCPENSIPFVEVMSWLNTTIINMDTHCVFWNNVIKLFLVGDLSNGIIISHVLHHGSPSNYLCRVLPQYLCFRIREGGKGSVSLLLWISITRRITPSTMTCLGLSVILIFPEALAVISTLSLHSQSLTLLWGCSRSLMFTEVTVSDL